MPSSSRQSSFTAVRIASGALVLALVGGCASSASTGDSTAVMATPAANHMTAPVAPPQPLEVDGRSPAYDRPGFVTFGRDGRLWVFAEAGEGLDEFQRLGEPARNVTWIGEGPNGMSLRSDSADTLLAYIGSRPGFEVFARDGRLWVFTEGSDAIEEFLTIGEPAKSVTVIGVGPRGATVRSDDRDVIDRYLAAVN